MTMLVVGMPGNELFATSLANHLGADYVTVAEHRFPDEEVLVRFPRKIENLDIVLVCTLDRPDNKILPLLFAAGTARQLGAKRVGLVAPYLCYMRQDKVFHEGEAISARLFAKIMSQNLDWIATVEPHLHRIHTLHEMFGIPAIAVHADKTIADWIGREVQNPILIGPDSESAQWLEAVAARIGCPFSVLAKERRGDDRVIVSQIDPYILASRTPVILDDVISTGQTILQASASLKNAGTGKPVVVGVHAVFANNAYALVESAASRVVTTNTILHHSNNIDIVPCVARAIREQNSI